MWRSVARIAVVLGLLGTAVGCGGGGDDGSRGMPVTGSAGGSGLGVDPTSRPSMRTVAYLPTYHGALATWTSELAFQNISYINVCFANVDASGNISVGDQGLYGLVAKAHAAGAKVCVAMGGATVIKDGGVFATLLTDANRPAFVENAAKLASDYKLDCLDVDLEGNGVNQYYEAFVTELSARLHTDGRELSAAVAGWFGDQITNNAMLSFDFINVMAYDLYSTTKVPMQWSSVEAATSEVDKWVARGMPKERVVYGVPFYGLQWPVAGGTDPQQITYADLLRRNSAAATQDELQDANTVTYLNSRATIQAKAKLARGYGGIMAWEAGQDATGDASLLQAIRDAVP